jgi:hypothetical protein
MEWVLFQAWALLNTSSETRISHHIEPSLPTLQVGDIKEDHMNRTVVMLSATVLLSCWNLQGFTPAYGFSNGLEPVVWNSNQKSSAWAEELLGQVVTYQTMAEKNLIPGSFQAYVDQTSKIRELHRGGNRRATYDSVNALMVMLEARVGGIDGHSADALWDFCYRVTPDEFHARDRHIRAKGADTVKEHEEFMRNMEERAGMSF